MIERLLLFGATGDLAGRFLLPALAELYDEGELSGGFRVVGAAIEGWDDETFRRHAARQLERHAAADVSAASREALVRSLRYRRVDFDDPGSVAEAVAAACGGSEAGDGTGPVAAYLALPTAAFAPAVRALGEVGLPPGSRIVLEKPFGGDLQSAVELNRLLARVGGVAGERAVFRVDHALALATVQNLLAVRLANRVLEPLWNGTHIEQVELLWDETLALEGRASYYDHAGALKDVIQNHLLQILCVIVMEPPISLDAQDFRDHKLDVLRSVRPFTPEDAASRSRRARYTAGRLARTGGADGQAVPDYAREKGVDPRRETETFAEVVLELEGWRWTGTRFVLRAGKALARRRKEAMVRFRPVPDLPFGHDTRPAANELRIGLDGPYDLALTLTGWTTGPPHLAPLSLGAELSAPELPAYGRVLMGVLGGDSALSIRGDEAEEAWRVVTPVLRAWADGRVPLKEYLAGSTGPPPPAKPWRNLDANAAAVALLAPARRSTGTPTTARSSATNLLRTMSCVPVGRAPRVPSVAFGRAPPGPRATRRGIAPLPTRSIICT